MTDGTLDDKYFEWLYSHVGAVRNRNPARSYWRLTRVLYTTAFDWSIPNDDNRMEDGMDLRFEFLDETHTADPEPTWMGLQCSMLEMLIALSRRACFESQGTPGDWFWHILQNVNFKGYTDKVYNKNIEREVRHTLHSINERTYQKDGRGGLFPLRHAVKDQRKIELWYQLSAYLMEGDYIDHGPLG